MEGAQVDKKTILGSSSAEDLFGIIESAIQVAALKFPQDFSTRRSKVVELLSKNSCLNTKAISTYHIKNIEEEPPQKKKKLVIRLKLNGGVLKNEKDCDHKQGMKPVKVSPTMETDQQVINKEKEIIYKRLKVEALKRKIEERYMESTISRKTVRVMDLCDLPPHHLWSRRRLKQGKESLLSKGFDRKQVIKSVKVSQPKVAQEVIKNEKGTEICSKNMKLDASKRKIAERYMEAKKARKTIQVLEFCDLPRQQADFPVEKRASAKPRTIRRKL